MSSGLESDIVIVGAGHNALICAAYLAEAGLKVTVLEGRDVIGGNTITEELTLPGWQHDSCSSAHVVIQSNPLIAADELGLMKNYGLRYIVTDPAVVIPLENNDALIIHPDVENTAMEFERFSMEDAQALRVMMKDWNDGLRIAHAHFQAGLPLPEDNWSIKYELLRQRSAWEVVMDTFKHPVIRRAVMWMAFATIQPPDRLGTGALPSAIISGRLKFGWTTPVGGSGALPDALAKHIEDHGGQIRTSSWATRFIDDNGRCVGVETSDGTIYRATRAVVTGSHIQELPKLLDAPSHMIAEAASLWRPGLSVFAVHLALRSNVRYRTLKGEITAVAAGLGSPEGLRRQVNAALAGKIDASDPWLLMVGSTVVDPDRAPGGVFKFLTIAPTLVDGQSWTSADADEFAQNLLKLARKYVDGLDEEDILFMRVESPTTIAAHNLSNIGGSCHGGEFALEDGSVIPGWLDYRTDKPGLYLTGSTSHPGGSVSGRPGRNTARILLDDLEIGSEKVMSRP